MSVFLTPQATAFDAQNLALRLKQYMSLSQYEADERRAAAAEAADDAEVQYSQPVDLDWAAQYSQEQYETTVNGMSSDTGFSVEPHDIITAVTIDQPSPVSSPHRPVMRTLTRTRELAAIDELLASGHIEDQSPSKPLKRAKHDNPYMETSVSLALSSVFGSPLIIVDTDETIIPLNYGTPNDPSSSWPLTPLSRLPTPAIPVDPFNVTTTTVVTTTSMPTVPAVTTPIIATPVAEASIGNVRVLEDQTSYQPDLTTPPLLELLSKLQGGDDAFSKTFDRQPGKVFFLGKALDKIRSIYVYPDPVTGQRQPALSRVLTKAPSAVLIRVSPDVVHTSRCTIEIYVRALVIYCYNQIENNPGLINALFYTTNDKTKKKNKSRIETIMRDLVYIVFASQTVGLLNASVFFGDTKGKLKFAEFMNKFDLYFSSDYPIATRPVKGGRY